MRTNTGIVVFAKMNKTAAVEIKIMTIHSLYKKRIWKKRKYLVHNDLDAKVGDKVVFAECRPISKKVHWIITKVLVNKESVIATPSLSKGKQSRPKRTVKRSTKK